MPFSVDETLLPRLVNLSTSFRIEIRAYLIHPCILYAVKKGEVAPPSAFVTVSVLQVEDFTNLKQYSLLNWFLNARIISGCIPTTMET